MSDVGSPAAVSRHLVLPLSSGQTPQSAHNEDSDEDSTDEGRVPSFCVLLHGALKVFHY